MNLQEYNKVKDLTYLEYCDYLQEKYGIGNCDYFTEGYSKKSKVTRTKEGLFAHHKYEDHAILLGEVEHAKRNPFEWQRAENIVYCDWLEHLLLHILICEYPSKDKNAFEDVGIGGAINHIIPELNDLYSGMTITLPWKQNCFNLIKNDLDTYIALVKRGLISFRVCPTYDRNKIFSSMNELFGTWSTKNNLTLYKKFEM